MKVGVIVDLELPDYPHGIHRQMCYRAVCNIFDNVRRVKLSSDLDGLDLLIIADDHHEAHKNVFRQPFFIEYANYLDLKVVVLTSEKIFNGWFYWDIDHYETVCKFKNLIHHSIEVEDAELLRTPIYRTLFSEYFKNIIDVDVSKKKDKILFMGHTGHIQYNERIRGLDFMKKEFGDRFDIVDPNLPTYRDYLNKLAEYRFVYSPVGNGNFFTFRFYEALLAKCIPIHQVRDNTLSYYDIEARMDDVIFFQDPIEVIDKVKNCTTPYSHSELWQEDNMKRLLTYDGLL